MSRDETRIHPAVRHARERLREGRDAVRTLHESGASGPAVCEALTQTIDAVVLALYDAARAEMWESESRNVAGQAALIAHSGYGRREMAPGSDVDVLLLYEPAAEASARFLSKWLSGAVFDAGLQLGFAARTLANVWEMAASDATVYTGLVEARLLAGEATLFQTLGQRFDQLTRRSRRGLLAKIDEARHEERDKHGDTVNVLCPNLKRGRGGLRDAQWVRWIGRVCHDEREPERLVELGALSVSEHRRLTAARDFLLRVRNELHFHAGRAVDVLDRAEQVRVALKLGHQGRPGLLPVEEFMREYFRHSHDVSDVVEAFRSRQRAPDTFSAILRPLFSHLVEGDYRVGTDSISITRSGIRKLRGRLSEVLRLMELAGLADKQIDPRTLDEVRAAAAAHHFDESPLDDESRKRFLSLLAQPRRVGELLRQLHSLRLLERLVPGVDHARCLLQFNDYHKFTVDEHSLRAVEAAAGFLDDAGPIGDAYRAIRQKRTLHLAALMHDLGKGFEEDHSEVGARLAKEAGALLSLPPDETETLAFLVLKHLRMNHLAQQRDIHDPKVVAAFAAEVGSPDQLRMLFVLTCADLAAVGPGVLTDWKRQLLTDLYRHTLALISSDSPEIAAEKMLRPRREAVQKAALANVRDPASLDWWRRQIDVLPASYLMNVEPERLTQELERLRTLPRDQAIASGRWSPTVSAVEYTVGTWEDAATGIFHRLAGALTTTAHSILGAEIHTLADGLVLDRFFAHDSDSVGPPTPDRIASVCRALERAVQSAAETPPVVRKVWAPVGSTAAEHARLPPKVRFDNDSSDRHTIVTIFTYDRGGLLYAIGKTLFDLGLSIAVAKIATHLDQVVDVFYVTDRESGQRVVDPIRLATIKERLLAAATG